MGQLTLPNAARVYINTVTVIYAVEQAPTYGVLLNPLWNSLQVGREVDFALKDSVENSENWIRRNDILTAAQVIYEQR